MRYAVRFFVHSHFVLVVAVSVLLLQSCNEGLAPPAPGGPSGTNEKTTIAGTIHFVGGVAAWPPKDSVVSIRVVAFISYPPTNIFGDVISGKAFYTEPALPAFVDSVNYTLDIAKPPAEFAYIVVGQQYGPNLSADWRVIGVYTLSGDRTQPSTLPITPGRLHDHIDIDVDFSHLPPQPF